MREFSDDLSPAEKKVLQDVLEEGVHIVHVPHSEDGPGFSATIGLWFHFEQPEVIVFGMPEPVADDLLNAVTDAADEGKRFKHGEDHKDLFVGYSVRFLDVPKEKVADYLGTAQWAYDSTEFPVVQLVWPDKQQRWPWQEGVRDGFRESQPILGSHEA
tara:strand:- start:92151 stop:92624 length:474 start_codon:yes stop_codon:yes gene_type:complete